MPRTQVGMMDKEPINLSSLARYFPGLEYQEGIGPRLDFPSQIKDALLGPGEAELESSYQLLFDPRTRDRARFYFICICQVGRRTIITTDWTLLEFHQGLAQVPADELAPLLSLLKGTPLDKPGKPLDHSPVRAVQRSFRFSSSGSQSAGVSAKNEAEEAALSRPPMRP
jgi:hypothetical protein